jgi:hypothetical protein
MVNPELDDKFLSLPVSTSPNFFFIQPAMTWLAIRAAFKDSSLFASILSRHHDLLTQVRF